MRKKYRERDVLVGASSRREVKQLKRATDRAAFSSALLFLAEERRGPSIDPGREWSRTSGGSEEDVLAGSCGITCSTAAGTGSVDVGRGPPAGTV